MAGDKTALVKAARLFNGQIVTKTGVQTLNPKMKGGMPDLGGPGSSGFGGLDSMQKGSAAGVLNKGKSKLVTSK